MYAAWLHQKIPAGHENHNIHLIRGADAGKRSWNGAKTYYGQKQRYFKRGF